MSEITKAALDAAIIREQEANRDWSSAAKRWNEEKSLLESEIAALREQVRWRDVSVDGYPEKAQDLLFVRDRKTVYGAWIGDRFWYNNEHVAVLNWLPLPPPQGQSHE